ncbi:MAG TPA: HAD hydrolase family protein [Candidatus Brocadiia bacterium]|nr:HAD hydrolase family protein [Candidatus Brocadiia bacterium]
MTSGVLPAGGRRPVAAASFAPSARWAQPGAAEDLARRAAQRATLFVFDLDGTALGGYEPYDRIPGPFARFLDSLAARGAAWATNSTWSPLAQAAMIERSGVGSTPAFLFGRTGLMRSRGLASGRVVYDADWARSFVPMEAAWISEFLPALRRLCAQFPGASLALVEGEPLLCSILANGADWPSLLASVRSLVARHAEASAAIDAGVKRVRFQPAVMNKATALRAMQKDLAAPPQRTLVAGDGGNDLPMLDPGLAAFLVCPDNAAPEVRARVLNAGGRAGAACFSDGVLDAVAELFASRP